MACSRQGLFVNDAADSVWLTEGYWGYSKLRRYDLDSKSISHSVDIGADFFAEGAALDSVDNVVAMLTYRKERGFAFSPQTLAAVPQRNFEYAGEGWGLTFNGEQWIKSNGSAFLTFHDRLTFGVTRELAVRDLDLQPLQRLNELEFVLLPGSLTPVVLANVWFQERFVVIALTTGLVLHSVDLTALNVSPGGVAKLCGRETANGM